MRPKDESSDQTPAEPSTDAELFDTAVDVGEPDDGAIDNPNSDT
jgi:hypothetical protein